MRGGEGEQEKVNGKRQMGKGEQEMVNGKMRLGKLYSICFGLVYFFVAGWWPNKGWYQTDAEGEVSTCNQLTGTDGQQWPPFVEEGEVLYTFQSDGCRSIALRQTSPDMVDIDGQDSDIS